MFQSGTECKGCDVFKTRIFAGELWLTRRLAQRLGEFIRQLRDLPGAVVCDCGQFALNVRYLARTVGPPLERAQRHREVERERLLPTRAVELLADRTEAGGSHDSPPSSAAIAAHWLSPA